MVPNKSKRSKEMIVSVMERSRKVGKLIKQKCLKVDVKNAIPLAVLVLVLVAQQEGWTAEDPSGIEAQTKTVIDMVFSPWIRKIGMAFGGFAGIIQAWSSGTFKPLFVWGGLGLAIGFVPKVIDVLVKV